MARIERTYNVPLRKEWLHAPSYKRAKKAINALTEFIRKHMKSDKVKLGNALNLKMWERGIKNPPHHIKITAVKDEDGQVRVELFGIPFKKEKMKEEKKGLKERLLGKSEKKGIKETEDKKEAAEKKETGIKDTGDAEVIQAVKAGKETKAKIKKEKPSSK